MATKEQPFPETMISPESGETLTRGVRPFRVVYKSESVSVDLPGYYPKGEGDGVHVVKTWPWSTRPCALSRRRWTAFLRRRAFGVCAPSCDCRSARRGPFLKSGSAFDKYERGLVEPSGPTIQLMALLDRHPELVAELR